MSQSALTYKACVIHMEIVIKWNTEYLVIVLLIPCPCTQAMVSPVKEDVICCLGKWTTVERAI